MNNCPRPVKTAAAQWSGCPVPHVWASEVGAGCQGCQVRRAIDSPALLHYLGLLSGLYYSLVYDLSLVMLIIPLNVLLVM